MKQTFDEFIATWTGKPCEVAGSANAKNQCVDLVNAYIRDVLNLPIIEWTNAQDFPSKAGDKYEWIPNTPKGVPAKGDIMVWKSKDNVGHIGVFIEPIATSPLTKFNSFDQNWPTGSTCHVQAHTYTTSVGTDVIGWLRKVAIIDPVPHTEEPMNDQTIIDLGGEFGKLEIQAIRSKLNDNATDIRNMSQKIEQDKISIDALTKAKIDTTTELTTTQTEARGWKNKYEELLAMVAKKLGVTQDEPRIEAELDRVITAAEKCEHIEDNRPVVAPSPIHKFIEALTQWLNSKLPSNKINEQS